MKQKRQKIAVIFCATLGALICISSFVQILVISRTTEQAVAESYATDCAQITNAYSLALANKISEYLNQMRYYSDADVVYEANEEEILYWLKEHSGNRKAYFSSVMFAGKDGLAYTDIGTEENISNTSFFKAIVENGRSEYVDNPSRDASGNYVFHIARAATLHGEIIGVFAAVVKLDTLLNMVNYIKLGDTGAAWVIADTGLVIAHNDKSFPMKINLLTGMDAAHKSVSDLVSHAIQGGIGSGWVRSVNGRGQDFVAYTPIANTPWTFAFSMSVEQLNATGNYLRTIIVITAILTGLALIFATMFVASKTLRPLKVVEQSINGIASGNADLSKRIDINSNTEIGSVVEGFNRFTEKLQSIVHELKKSKVALSQVGEDLHNSADDTARTNDAILDTVSNLKRLIGTQAQEVEHTSSSVERIAASIGSLEELIDNQAGSVTEASTAVAQMISNINSVNTSVEKMAASFAQLEQNARDGAEKQKSVNARIEQIESESEMLQQANAAISSIASQTNLLAMNAAIEAAHAGAAGQGFSVVADEIRKLSETSSSQSKTIRTQLSKIKESITSVVTASAESSGAFNSVAEGIHSTDELVQLIRTAMQEQTQGSEQINQALSSMNDSTLKVRTASVEMAQGNQAVLEGIKNLQNSTGTMKGSMSQMDESAHKITQSGASLSSITKKMQNSIDNIGSQIDQFQA